MSNALRPNVLFVIVDDQRIDTVGALGNPHIRTPTLDRLVREGTTFTHHFTMVPICTPARAAILTGCDNFSCGVRWFGQSTNPQKTLLPQAFAQAGYHTFFTGKWHNDGKPSTRGFVTARRVFNGGMMVHHGMTIREGDGEGEPVSGFSTDLFADAALEFINGSHQQPWFAYVSFTSPHDPRTPPAEYAALYDPDKIPLPTNYLPEHPFDNGEMTIRDEQLEAWPRTQGAIKQHLADYYGMITHHDKRVGDLLDALDATGQADNTIVVYTGDHGLALGSHGLLGKENLYEHSVRKLCLLRGPGVPASKRDATLSCDFDLFPTLCELSSIPTPPSVEGKSLARRLNGSSVAHREHVFGAYRTADGSEVMRSVRGERWKLIHYLKIDRWQLFDLENDPDELRDLLLPWRYEKNIWQPFAPDGEPFRAIASDLRARLGAWQKQVNDPAAAEE